MTRVTSQFVRRSHFLLPGLSLPAALALGGLLWAVPAQRTPPAAPKEPVSATVRAVPAEIMPPPPAYHFPDKQTWVYSVEWHLFNAGTASVRMEPAGTERHVVATAGSQGVANLLYPVHDRFQAAFDPKSFCSLSISKHTEEGSRKRETEIHFEYSRRKSVLHEKNLKTDETKRVENDVPACVTDIVTGFYYLASLPLTPGAIYSFPINDGGKTAEVKAQVEAREPVKAPAGTFQTLRVEAEATSGLLNGKGKIWIWYSDDANHTPVQMRAKLGWGTLLFRLQRVDRQP